MAGLIKAIHKQMLSIKESLKSSLMVNVLGFYVMSYYVVSKSRSSCPL